MTKQAEQAQLDNLKTSITGTMQSWFDSLTVTTTPPVVTPPVTTPVDPPVSTPAPKWSSGVWAEHNNAEAVGWFTWLGKSAADLKGTHVTAFVTHAGSEADMTQGWWQSVVPAGRGLSLRVPLVPGGDPNLATDRSNTFKIIAKQAGAVDASALICPGWEMNLAGWPSHVTPGNRAQWITAWKRTYTALKSTVPSMTVAFNANGGDINATGVDLGQLLGDLVGYFDAVGTDQYDCWPGMLSAATIDTMMNRPGGLNWWMSQAKLYGVPLVVPEWGVSSGSQWAAHTGKDNPAYISAMWSFFNVAAKTGKGLLAESYFNGAYPELLGDIYRLGTTPSSNPKSAAMYRSLFARAA